MTDPSVERQLGEIFAILKVTNEKVEQLDTKVSSIQNELAENRGGKRAMGFFGGLIGGIVSAVGTACAIIFGFGGMH